MKPKKTSKPAASKKSSPIQILAQRLEATVPDGRTAFLEATGARLVPQLAAHYRLSTAGNAKRCIGRIVEHLGKVDTEKAVEGSPPADVPPANDARDDARGADQATDGAPAPNDATAGAPDAPSVEPGAAAKPGRRPSEPDPRLPAVGTVIIKRDRQGNERARCTIVDGGIEYSGTTYRSISAAAMAAAKDLGLTSKTQDGYAFWGLKKSTSRPTKKDPVEALGHAWDRYLLTMGKLVDGASDDDRTKLRDTIRRQAATLQVHATDPA